jgi:hypothetical protein
VWSAEASLNCEDVDDPVDEAGGMDDDEDEDAAEPFVTKMDAVAIDNRERTRSSGYVVPVTKFLKALKETKHKAMGQVRRTDRSNTSESTAGQSGGGIQLFLPVRGKPLGRMSFSMAIQLDCYPPS